MSARGSRHGAQSIARSRSGAGSRAGLHRADAACLREPTQDLYCGFKLWRATPPAAVFPRQRLHGWVFDAEVLALARGLGFRVREVGVVWNDREGSKLSISEVLIPAIRELLAARRSVRAQAPGVARQTTVVDHPQAVLERGAPAGPGRARGLSLLQNPARVRERPSRRLRDRLRAALRGATALQERGNGTAPGSRKTLDEDEVLLLHHLVGRCVEEGDLVGDRELRATSQARARPRPRSGDPARAASRAPGYMPSGSG